jgi:hypothetical protein
LPNDKLVGVTLSICVSASNSRAKLFETLPALAVSVTACGDETHCEVTVNAALTAPDGTVTAPGRLTDELLLARYTTSPELGAPVVSVTLQASLPPPAMLALLQEIPLNAATAVVEDVVVPPK